MAGADGRSEPAINDIMRAAAGRSTSRHLAHIASMFELMATREAIDRQALEPATAAEVDEIFQRAGAFAVALDEPLEADHVAAVAARMVEDEPGPMALFRLGLMGMVAGPDEDDQRRIQVAIQDQADRDEFGPLTSELEPTEYGKVWSTSFRSDTDDDTPGGVAPRCGGCQRSYGAPLRMIELVTEVGPVNALACPHCGTVLAVLQDPRPAS